MRRGDRAAETAVDGRRGADRSIGVITASRARRKAVRRVQLDVGRDISRRRLVASRLLGFQGILVNGRVQLTHVVDAGIRLRGGTRFHEVRNRNRRQQADDGHNDHDFDEREARLTEVFGLFHVFTFFVCGVNNTTGGLYDYNSVHLIACRNRSGVTLALTVPKSI